MIAVIADLHIRGKDRDEFEAQLEAVIESIIQKKCTLVLLPGDIFDASNVADSYASTGDLTLSLRKHFSRLLNNGVKDILAIPGNHDKANESMLDALAILEPMFTVIRTPKWYKIQEIDIACLPWIWSGDADRLLADLAKTKPNNSKYSILLGHLRVVRAWKNNNIQARKESFAASMESISSFPVDRVCLGDLHMRQDLTNGRGGFVGSLRQCRRTEEGNPQGYELIDPTTGNYEFVEINEYPRYFTTTWSVGSDPVPEIPENVRATVKVSNDIPEEEIKKLEESGVRVITPTKIKTRTLRTDEELDFTIKDDPLELFNVWQKHIDTEPVKGRIKERILAKIEEITN